MNSTFTAPEEVVAEDICRLAARTTGDFDVRTVCFRPQGSLLDKRTARRLYVGHRNKFKVFIRASKVVAEISG